MANEDCTTLTKVCTTCGQQFPATMEYWSPNRLGKLGLNSKCKPCEATRASEYRRRQGHKERPKRKRKDERQCSHCNQWLPATSEYFGVRSDNGHLRSWCRECRREKRRIAMRGKRKDPEFYEKELARGREYNSRPEVRKHKRLQNEKWRKDPINQERRRRYTHEYEQRADRRQSRRARNHTMRAMRSAAEGTHTRDDILAIHEAQKGKCWWCGKKLKGKYEVDHRIPLSRGGTNWPNNLCITCVRCNRSKNNKLPHEWIGRLL